MFCSSSADVEDDDPLVVVHVRHVPHFSIQQARSVFADEMSGESGLAFAALAIQDPNDGSVIGLFFDAVDDGLLPGPGHKVLVGLGRFEGLSQCLDALTVQQELFRVLHCDVMICASCDDCLHEPVQVRSVALSPGIEMSHLDRFRHLCVLFGAVCAALFSGAAGCFQVAFVETRDGVVDGAAPHGFVPFAVSLDVDSTCSRSALHLGNAVAGGGKIVGHGEEEVLGEGKHNIFLADFCGVECIVANVEEYCPTATTERFLSECLHFVSNLRATATLCDSHTRTCRLIRTYGYSTCPGHAPACPPNRSVICVSSSFGAI